MKLKVENFQIIKKAILKIEGITLLIGSNNNGKTSVVRALQSVLYNNSNRGIVRDGSKMARVSLSFPEEEDFESVDLVWEKKEKSGGIFYIGEEKFSRMGKGVPQEYEGFGISEIQYGRTKVKLNFSSQWEPPLLLNDSGAVCFEFLSQIRKEASIIPVLKNMKLDLKDQEKEAVKLEGAISVLQDQEREIEEEQGELEDIVVSTGADIDTANKLWNIYSEKREFIQKSKKNSSSLKELRQERDILEREREELSKIVGEMEKLSQRKEEMESFLIESREAQRKEREAKKRKKVLASLSKNFGPALTRFGKLVSIYSKLSEVEENLKTQLEFKNTLEKRRRITENQYNAIVKSLGGVCPFCGNSFKEKESKNGSK